MKTYVHALDLSLNSTGICIFTNDGEFVKAFTVDTHALEETKQKLKMIGDMFIELIKRYPPELAVIEQGFSLYNRSTQMVFRVHGLANYIYSQYEQIYYPAATVKKVIGGSGNMSKIEIREILERDNPGITFKSYDESDAFAVAKTYFILRKR